MTIKDIAKKAGVSPTTVANVIHGNYARVSKETRKKVEKYIKQYNYAPNMGAVILAHNCSRIIGVIMFIEPRRDETVFEDPFTSAAFGAIEQEVKDNGYFLMVYTTSDKDEVLRLAKTWKFEGLIIFWVPDKIGPEILDNIEKPVVFIDSHLTCCADNYYNVGLQDEEGGYQICRHLISMGHTNVVFLSNDTFSFGTDEARFKGCQNAFKEENINLSLENRISLPKIRKERFEIYKKLASKDTLHTALVFSADYYAAEASSYLQECGIRVPEDISITGFDNNFFAKLSQPQLTTIHQNSRAKGSVAVKTLIKLIKKKEVKEKNIQLGVELVVRNSVKNLTK